jgi:NADPH-dependent 2,4-dienoyl-CoA reductase/sulfur reductase-like enzyme
MNIREKNYWLDTVAEPATGAAGALPDKADVAVVGGGFCGLSAARVLAQRGVRVALLEAESMGWAQAAATVAWC